MGGCQTGVGGIPDGIVNYKCGEGFGSFSPTQHAFQIGDLNNKLKSIFLEDMKFWIGKTGADPVQVTLAAGSGINLVYDSVAGTYTISTLNFPMSWINVTATTQQLVPQTGYINNSTTLCSYALPATSTLGQEIIILGRGPGQWKITQATGQSIEFGNITTTVGTSGSLASNLPSDHIKLICVIPNTTWKVESATDLMWA